MVHPQHTTHNPCFCSINNIGVALLQCGRPREAADVLAKGLKEIRHAMTASAPDSSCSYYACTLCHSSPKSADSRHAISHETSPPIISIPRKNCFVVASSSSEDDDCTVQGHDEHELPQNTKIVSKGFLFSCPITTPPHASCHNVTFDHWCFVMLYNLALSYDILAWSNHGSSTNDAKDDRLALSFYQLAYRVQQNTTLGISTIYLCGMLNNMARLHRSRKEMDAVRECLSGMTTILMYITTQNQVYGLLVQGGGEGGARSRILADEQTAYYMAQFWNSVLTEAGAGTPPTTAGAA